MYVVSIFQQLQGDGSCNRHCSNIKLFVMYLNINKCQIVITYLAELQNNANQYLMSTQC